MIAWPLLCSSRLARWAGRYGRAVEDAVEDYACAFSTEGQLAGRHFVEDNAKRKEIGTGVQLLGSNLLGRHVSNSSQSRSWAREMLRCLCQGCQSVDANGGGFVPRHLRKSEI